ncbi:MAG: FAD-binding protein, partial [Actinobacteria bacterium]|nr:FAD-binding protein [Actinomycetota bacterium]
MASWRNWAGSVRANPTSLATPRTVEELQHLVRKTQPGRRIRMAGSGHSFTPIVPSNDVLLRPHDFGEGVGIDTARMIARIPAGMVLHDANQHLAAAGV